MHLFANSLFLCFIIGIPLYGVIKRVAIYDTFIVGAKGGLQLVFRIFPYLLAMLVAIGMFRASGAIDLIAHALSPALQKIGMPADILPLALLRPLSGSAGNGLLADIIHHHGGNAYVSQLAATIMGSTETTFYIVAVYFGAANIRRTRHAIPAGLIADLTCVLASLWICKVMFL